MLMANSLPKLSLQPSVYASPPASASDETTAARPIGGSQVQWAVKVIADPSIVPTAEVHPHDPNRKQSGSNGPRSNPKELEDFCVLLRDRYEGKRSLRTAFRNWDRDKDGRLSGKEVRELITSLGFSARLGRDKVETIIQHITALPSSYVFVGNHGWSSDVLSCILSIAVVVVRRSLRYEDFCACVYGRPDAATTALGGSMTKSKPPTASQEKASFTAAKQPDSGSDQALYPDMDRVLNIFRKKYESRKLRKVFRDWDGDKDGCITMNELDSNLRRQGIRLSPNQVKEIFDAYDGDRDGCLLYADFVKMICSPVAQDPHSNPIVQARLKKQAEKNASPHDPYSILRNSALENPAGVDV